MSEDKVDEERAKEFLADVIEEWFESGVPSRTVEDFLQTEDGEIIPIYSARSNEGHGSFRCEFMPLATAMKILKECEQVIEEAGFNYRSLKTGTVERVRYRDMFSGDIDSTVYAMGRVALGNILLNLRQRFCEAVEEAFEEAMLFVDASLHGLLYKEFEQNFGQELKLTRVNFDGRPIIESAVDKVAKRKRERLKETLKDVPVLRLPKSRGGSEPEVKATDEQCICFVQCYPEILKRWQKIRKSRGENPKGKWREHARLDYPDITDDLFDRLDDLDPYISKPSAIAHEHAARRCGVETNGCSESTLKRLRQRGQSLLGANQS